MKYALLGCIALITGCTHLTANAVLKAPVTDKCTSTGLKGCPELVDGMLLYAQGDEVSGQRKLREGIAQNSPEDVKRYAKTLLELSGLPGAKEFAGPVVEVASFLASQADAAGPPEATPAAVAVAANVASSQQPDRYALHEANRTRSTTKAEPQEPLEFDAPVSATAQRDRSEVLLYSINAASDPTRMITDSSSPATALVAIPCMIGDLAAKCVKLKAGPLVVTDVVALTGCPDSLFMGSGPETGSNGLRWLIEAQPTAVTGARLLVRGNEWLYAAVRPKGKEYSRDPRCVVTWSAFLPRLVPQ
jgi:hypothetical protein